ncbi:methyltransferase [Oceanicoccus sp. KOV_DT_Chl]|uniref:methyltransferase n=1 Tax=Oceanicoccus sp. KOV_DT_Chl TaxID=1904639 RepID=UPI000C7DB5AF|nr:methyltransferase [Oceanicoccus sp. KOV_DT_Chl]
MISYDAPDSMSALDAKFEAQKIAFAPIVFQATLALRDLGILEAVRKAKDAGITAEALAEKVGVSLYGVNVLLEVAMSSGIVRCVEGQFILTKTGYFLVRDDLTRVNMDFVNDVCYQAMFNLKDSIVEQKPSGLKVFSDADTIYEILATLPEKAKKSWFDFDHFYSDISFPEVLPLVFASKPKKIMDIGGNTGKWATQCLQYDEDVEVTIVDLPGQLNKAKENLEAAGLTHRMHFHEANMLDEKNQLPKGADIIWMSQFLDCFSLDEIVSILKRAKAAMTEDSRIYIMELLWDRQKYEAAAYSLHNISLYFTCLANGNSKMYHSAELLLCIERAGLTVEKQIDNIGISHSLITCRL